MIKLILLFVCVWCASAKVFQPCELAEELVKRHGMDADTAANWVCLAKFASGFKSTAVEGPLADGTSNYGIFQINEKYCKVGSVDYCGASREELVTEDIKDSVTCSQRIFKKKGFQAWAPWKNDCKGRNMKQYISRCSFKGAHAVKQ